MILWETLTENWYGLGAFVTGALLFWVMLKGSMSNGDDLAFVLLAPLLMMIWPVIWAYILAASAYSVYQRKVKKNPDYGYVAPATEGVQNSD